MHDPEAAVMAAAVFPAVEAAAALRFVAAVEVDSVAA
jgi:hypothetical protein